MGKDRKEEAKNQIVPLEDEQCRQFRVLSVLSYFFIMVIIGLPLWWFTTRVYRADLPLTEMSNLKLESKLSKQLGVPLSLEYDILISIVNPDPGNLKVKLDGREVSEALKPFVNKISSIAEFTIKSQWLYMVDIDLIPKRGSNQFIISEESLPHIITPLERNLGSHLSPRPCLNFIIYVPYCSTVPLNIHKEVGNHSIKSVSNAIISPSWGGIYILNPDETSCKKKLFEPRIENIVATITAQLKHLFHMNNIVDETEITKLNKWRAENLIESSKRTLKSLAKLLSEISSIVISNEVAEKIDIALENVQEAELYFKADEIIFALKYAKIAYNHSEKAFGDPSLLALLYFPDDQKYAVYIPLFLPIMIPVLMSLITMKRKISRTQDTKT